MFALYPECNPSGPKTGVPGGPPAPRRTSYPINASGKTKMPEVCGPSGLPVRNDGKPQGGAIPVACNDLPPKTADSILALSNPRPSRRFVEKLHEGLDSREPSESRKV